MEFQLKPPLFILPEFGNKTDIPIAAMMGITVGPLARVAQAQMNEVPMYLVNTPEDWDEIHDEFGMYLVDPLSRRRVYVPKPGQSYRSCASLLPRFAIQEWWLGGGGWWRYYVRSTMGKEENIFHYSCVFNKHQDKGIRFYKDYEQNFEDSSKPSAREACEQWLNTNYPDWKNPLAYWD
jgi:hypothetical protein